MKNADFQEVYKFGRAVNAGSLIMRWKPNNLGQPRLGIVVSTKTAKKASQRNLLRRRLRALWQERLKGDLSQVADDIVIIVRDGAADFRQLENDLRQCLAKFPSV